MPITRLSPHTRKYLVFSFMFSMVIGIVSAIYFVLAQPMLPLFYSVALSQAQLAPKPYIFTLPILSILINIIHTVIIHAIQKYDKVIQTLFTWSSLIVQTLLFLSLLRIIFITM